MSVMVFLDVDTQVDFMRRNGARYVPGADKLVGNLTRLLRAAHENGVPVVATLDTHMPDDPEFAIHLPHCIDRTPGHRKIPETVFEPWRRIVLKRQEVVYRLGETLVVEKNRHSLFDNMNADDVLKAVGAREVAVMGVATDYGVLAAALGLRQRGIDVLLVTDAIAPVDPAAGERALAEMDAAECMFVTTDQVLALLDTAATAKE